MFNITFNFALPTTSNKASSCNNQHEFTKQSINQFKVHPSSNMLQDGPIWEWMLELEIIVSMYFKQKTVKNTCMWKIVKVKFLHEIIYLNSQLSYLLGIIGYPLNYFLINSPYFSQSMIYHDIHCDRLPFYLYF